MTRSGYLHVVIRRGLSVSRSYDDLQKLFQKRKEENKPTFRGGQFAGAVPVSGLACALREFCQKFLRKLTPHILQWQEARKDRCRCVRALRNILSSIENIRVFGFGVYKRKKFAEFLVLAAMANVYSLHFEEQWLNDLCDVWPIPSNSKKNLSKIFLGIRDYHEGIIALLRWLFFPILCYSRVDHATQHIFTLYMNIFSPQVFEIFR